MQLRGMQVIGFAQPRSELRGELVDLVLAGTKTATAGLLADELRDRLGDPDWSLTDDTAIVCQRFRLVERFAEPVPVQRDPTSCAHARHGRGEAPRVGRRRTPS